MNRSACFSIQWIAILGLATAPVAAQFDAFISFVVPLNTSADSDTGFDSTPQLVTDGAGHWVAVWYSNEDGFGGGIGTDPDVLVARSTNNGATWTDPAPLNTNAGTDTGGDFSPHVATDRQGNWVAVWYSNEPNIDGVIDTDTDILVARSTDNGATWTDPAPLNNNAGSDSGGDSSPYISTDGNGNWVVAWESTEANIAGGISTDSDILVARSTDNGATWTDPLPLNNNADRDAGNDFDPSVSTDGAGNWVAAWESDEPDIAGGIGADRDIFVARSTDNAATWTDPAPLNTNAGSDSGEDYVGTVATDGQGNWLAVWESGEPDIAGGIGTDTDNLVARSADNGATWTNPAPLNTNAASDTQGDYIPDVASDGAGNWVAMWESNEPAVAGGIDTDSDILVARSTNNGASWTAPIPLNSNAGSDTGNDSEPRITNDGWGNWVGVWESTEPDIAGGINTDSDVLVARFALPDCNLNDIGDGQDIADGTSEDCDADGVPDECEYDIDDDGAIDPCDNCILTSNADQNDADADGVGDACDLCPDDPEKTDPGVCGCGNPDTDTDGDGAPDCIDPSPNNPNMCGCGNGILAMLPITLLGCTTIRRRIHKRTSG